MKAFINRAYEGPPDRQAMINLLAARPSARVADFPSIGDLQELLARPLVTANTQVWLADDDSLLGFAMFYAIRDETWFMSLEIVRSTVLTQVQNAIMAWGLDRVQQASVEQNKSFLWRVHCRADHATRIALLEAHDFVKKPIYAVHLERSLNASIPQPVLPLGFTIRAVAGEHEAEALAALHLAAFGTPYMTTENRLTWMRAPGYKPELDLVVETSEGQLAAFCLGGISEQDNARTGRKDGYTDPVGVHPNFQRRGLARALLLSAFQRLKERGMETAKLSTGSWNIAMQTAAQAVGYQITATTLYFEKALDLKKATAQ